MVESSLLSSRGGVGWFYNGLKVVCCDHGVVLWFQSGNAFKNAFLVVWEDVFFSPFYLSPSVSPGKKNAVRG